MSKSTGTKNGAVVAKQDDGTVQITFKIAWEDIEKAQNKVLTEEAKTAVIPGFRKGKAPLEKVREKMPAEAFLDKTLYQLLPDLYASALKQYSIIPAIYPKFELVSAKEEEDWEVRAITAQMPDFELGDYKSVLSKAGSSDIWVPGKGDPATKEELTREQKENIAIGALQENYKFTLPEVMVTEEVNSRLAALLERIEKLGLSLDSYLASIKKTAEQVRAEYREQAEKAIRLELVLGKIAQEGKVTVSQEEVDAFVNAANASGAETKITDQQKSTILAYLSKRKVIDKLASLVA